MKQWWRRVRPYIISGLIYSIARFIGITIRIKPIGYEKVKDLGEAVIFCGWHGRSLIPANFFKGKGLWAIISLSRDGEMQKRIFNKFGFNVIRGSTGRGGARAAVEAIRVLRKGESMAMTPDGPRGPSGVVQEGVILFAQKSGAALIPVGSFSKPGWQAPTWDRYLIPWPFAKAVFTFGDPIYVPADANEDESEAIRLKLEGEIHRMQRLAETEVGYTRHDG